MILSARPAASATNTGGVAASTQPSGPAGAPFDSVLALEAIAAEAGAAQLDLLSTATAEGGLEGLQDERASDEDGDADDDEAATGPLALLGMLASVTTRLHAHGAPGDTNIEDALASRGDSSAGGAAAGGQLGLALPLPDAGSEAGTASADELLAGAAAADAAKPADGSNDAPRPEWMTQGVRPGQGTEHAPIATHARDPRWAEEFGTRIALMVRGGESSAALQLTPVDLGPMEVSITVRDGQASIHFGAAQAETRALIEASIPRLREMLASQGFNLMDASVSQGFSRQGRPDVPRARLPAEPEAESPTAARIQSTRLLDTYA